MRIRLGNSSLSSSPEDHYLTSLLINDTVGIDAGCLGILARPEQQAKVRNVFVSHSHADHLMTLPVFVENTLFVKQGGVVVHGNAAVLDCIRRDMFNDRVWPDYFRLSKQPGEFLSLRELHAHRPVEVDGLRITAVPVEHPVPTFGFLVEDATSAVVIATDTGPTEEIWRTARQRPNLKMAFLDASFPESMVELASVSGHMIPSQFRTEVGKLPAGVRVVAVHIKAGYREQVVRELLALRLPAVEIGVPGREYRP
jgi:ribonuclease BN (tRNA processing enzyme)